MNLAERIGNFTSSEIVALISTGKGNVFGKPALTYIKECNMERRLGRSLTNESTAKTLSWGKLLEKRVFDLLGTNYTYTAKATIVHPRYDFWAGSPDGNKYDDGKTVDDIKCPETLKSFCNLVDPIYNGLQGIDAMNAIRDNHADGEKYYWQLVSNGILSESKYAELIVYVPYKSELDAIRELTQDYDGNPNDVAWIHFGGDEALTHLVDGGYYKNINIIRFEIPDSDKNLLTERVLMASKLLIKMPEVLLATHEPDHDIVMVQKG